MSICTVPVRPDTVWCQETIRNAGIDSTPIRQQGQTIHPTSMWQIPIPWQNSGQHPPLPNQCNCVPISQTNQRYHEANPPTINYLAMQEDAVLFYHASNMVLAVHSNVSYLGKPKAHSRAGGHFFLSSNTTVPPNNGAVLNIAHIIKTLCHSWPPKRNWQVSTLWRMRRCTSGLSSKNWDANNRQRLYKLIMQWQTPASMVKYNPNKSKQWT